MGRVKFILFFLVFAFAFTVGTSLVLDQPVDSFAGPVSQTPWKSVVSTVFFPLKIILFGPLLPFIAFLHQDPDTPPPFFLAGFALYWTILAAAIHYLLEKVRRAKA